MATQPIAKTPLFGRKAKGGIFSIVDESVLTGNIWWVDSGNTSNGSDAVGFGRNPDAPFLTINYAVDQATASNGDWIIVMAGHSEQVTTAGGLDLDKIGLTIKFLGEGANRATIDFAATTADMDIDAASITLINPRFETSIDAVAAPIDVNAANFTMKNAEWFDGANLEHTD